MNLGKILTAVMLAAGAAFAADLPRKSPEFPIQLLEGKQLLISSLHGKVVCFTFILTT